jgi:hypothetical protein
MAIEYIPVYVTVYPSIYRVIPDTITIYLPLILSIFSLIMTHKLRDSVRPVYSYKSTTTGTGNKIKLKCCALARAVTGTATTVLHWY